MSEVTEILQKKLIKNGIANLNEFGYPEVNEENILTDPIYSQFFKSMLSENKGYNKGVDIAIDGLISKISSL